MHFCEEDVEQSIVSLCREGLVLSSAGFVSIERIHDRGKMNRHRLTNGGKPEWIFMDNLVRFEETMDHGILTVFHNIPLARTDNDRMSGRRRLRFRDR